MAIVHISKNDSNEYRLELEEDGQEAAIFLGRKDGRSIVGRLLKSLAGQELASEDTFRKALARDTEKLRGELQVKDARIRQLSNQLSGQEDLKSNYDSLKAVVSNVLSDYAPPVIQKGGMRVADALEGTVKHYIREADEANAARRTLSYLAANPPVIRSDADVARLRAEQAKNEGLRKSLEEQGSKIGHLEGCLEWAKQSRNDARSQRDTYEVENDRLKARLAKFHISAYFFAAALVWTAAAVFSPVPAVVIGCVAHWVLWIVKDTVTTLKDG
jgi:chromosome segregation ATPase